jgi:hypothetical protein
LTKKSLQLIAAITLICRSLGLKVETRITYFSTFKVCVSLTTTSPGKKYRSLQKKKKEADKRILSTFKLDCVEDRYNIVLY